ncbi:hypothetical protein [Clostridium sp. YIM B02555]|uniref:hypothetical protein n=1 Tax=Clostridium sp. YIM B02555 TaxID=2911968 RepID=UPI001EEDC929|nr:hypothetical protein [Clostridium sp. YIM B02555]
MIKTILKLLVEVLGKKLIQVDALKQLQDNNTKLAAENESLKDQLSKVQALVAAN